MSSSVKIEGYKELAKTLDSLSKGEGVKVLRQGFYITGQEILVDSQKRLEANKSRSTGKLFRSGKVKTTTGGEIGVEINYNSDYAWYVEFGRKAGGMPPIKEILQWVKKKGFYSRSSVKTKRQSTTKAGRKAQESAAWAIAKSISRKGTKARPFLYPAYLSGSKKLVANVRKQFEAYIKSIKV